MLWNSVTVCNCFGESRFARLIAWCCRKLSLLMLLLVTYSTKQVFCVSVLCYYIKYGPCTEILLWFMNIYKYFLFHYSGTSIYHSRNDRFPACTVCHLWSRMKFHINNIIYSCIHRSLNYRFTAFIVCNSQSRRSISRMDRLKRKLKRSNCCVRYIALDYKSGNTVMQSRFARGLQLHIRVISIISELYLVASGSVLSRVISSIWFICFR